MLISFGYQSEGVDTSFESIVIGNPTTKVNCIILDILDNKMEFIYSEKDSSSTTDFYDNNSTISLSYILNQNINKTIDIKMTTK